MRNSEAVFARLFDITNQKIKPNLESPQKELAADDAADCEENKGNNGGKNVICIFSPA